MTLFFQRTFPIICILLGAGIVSWSSLSLSKTPSKEVFSNALDLRLQKALTVQAVDNHYDWSTSSPLENLNFLGFLPDLHILERKNLWSSGNSLAFEPNPSGFNVVAFKAEACPLTLKGWYRVGADYVFLLSDSMGRAITLREGQVLTSHGIRAVSMIWKSVQEDGVTLEKPELTLKNLFTGKAYKLLPNTPAYAYSGVLESEQSAQYTFNQDSHDFSHQDIHYTVCEVDCAEKTLVLQKLDSNHQPEQLFKIHFDYHEKASL